MRLGFCTPLDDDSVRFASASTFDGIELVLAPGGPLDPATASDDDVSEARDLLEDEGVAVLSVFHFEDYASPTDGAGARERLVRAMDIATTLGAETIGCNAWVGGATEDDDLASFVSTFAPAAEEAELRGLRLAIENCPHGKRNLAWSPAMWEKMFNLVPSEAIGLEYDPSHLIWEGIDPVGPIREFGNRIFAFHAKDTEVLPDVLRRVGILGEGWWRYRIPGWGQVDWKGIFQALAEIRFDGDLIIEHEDPTFTGEQFQQGLRLGLRHLRKFVP